jgi:hypothetical protein
MATDLSIHLHGPMPQDKLQRIRELLRLETADTGANAPRDEVGRRYLDDLHTAFLVLLRRADDAWEAQVTSLLAPASRALVQQCTEDVRAAAAELALAVQGEGDSDTETEAGTPAPQGAAPKVTAPPPGTGPVSLEQAEAIAAEWINAGRPDDGQVGAGVYEFELGYIVYPVGAPSTEIGTARGIIDKQTGECSVWPSLSLEMVADLYRNRGRKPAAAGGGGRA